MMVEVIRIDQTARAFRQDVVMSMLDEEIKMLKIQEEKVCCAKNVNQIMGYEKIAARYYFQGLSKI